MALNKWLGSDKPKKDDFNADNQKIDDAFKAISRTADELTEALNTGIASGLEELLEHIGNMNMHVTSEEKNTWSSFPKMVIGSYNGNGDTTRKIVLGYKPLFGVVFTANDGVGRVTWDTSQYLGNAGFLSALGCTLGLSLEDDGFTARYSPSGGADGFAIRFNASSTKYIYVLWV